jgi:GT2 family glycosyltransferase
MEKIAAVVVTYNRKEMLIKNLNSLFNQTKQLDSIIIIDNASTDGTKKLLKEKKFLSKDIINYYRLDKNTGGAGGFYYGTKKAYENNFDWVWLMDDDCIFQKNSLEKIFNLKLNKNNAYACLRKDLEKKKDIIMNIDKTKLNEDKIAVRNVPFNGFLINRRLINEIGYPEKNYFIYGDDDEYCLRIKENEGEVFVITDSIVFHPNKIMQYSYKRGVKYTESFLSEFRVYYGTRNSLINRKKYFNKNINLISLSKSIIKYLILGEFKLIKLKLLGVWDGLNFNFYNRV